MIKFKTICMLLSLACLFACSSEENSQSVPVDKTVQVSVNFSGLDISVVPDNMAQPVSRASASEAGVNRISFKVFDKKGGEVYSIAKNSDTDEDFDHVDLPLHAGEYTFVAVAHKAKENDAPAADIVSASEASVMIKNMTKTIYSKVMDVTVAGNDTQNFTIEFGKVISSTFILNVTDAYPDDVEKVQIVVNTSKDVASSPYHFNPATGFATSDLSYTYTCSRSEYGAASFTGRTVSASLLLTAEEQHADVVINMMNAKDVVLYTRTLHDVTFRHHCITKATGTFFISLAEGSFSFDTSRDVIDIPLNQ